MPAIGLQVTHTASVVSRVVCLCFHSLFSWCRAASATPFPSQARQCTPHELLPIPSVVGRLCIRIMQQFLLQHWLHAIRIMGSQTMDDNLMITIKPTGLASPFGHPMDASCQRKRANTATAISRAAANGSFPHATLMLFRCTIGCRQLTCAAGCA